MSVLTREEPWSIQNETSTGDQPVTKSMLDNERTDCERCGGAIPTFAEHQVKVVDNGEYLCSECSRSDENCGGYHVEDGNGNRTYG